MVLSLTFTVFSPFIRCLLRKIIPQKHQYYPAVNDCILNSMTCLFLLYRTVHMFVVPHSINAPRYSTFYLRISKWVRFLKWKFTVSVIKIKSYSSLANVNNSGSPAGARSFARLILLIAWFWTSWTRSVPPPTYWYVTPRLNRTSEWGLFSSRGVAIIITTT